MKRQNLLHGKVLCQSGKRGYSTKKAALGARDVSFRDTGKELWTYKCDKCKQFHLTSRKQN